MEEWKNIIGFESYYQISNFGNVRPKDRVVKSKNNSLANKLGKIKKAGITNGYKVVLFRGGVSKKDIAKQFSHISYSSVCRILKGKTWKHMDLSKTD